MPPSLFEWGALSVKCSGRSIVVFIVLAMHCFVFRLVFVGTSNEMMSEMKSRG